MKRRTAVPPSVPRAFMPPIVRTRDMGIPAFHAYDWYFAWLARYLAGVKHVFLTPCAATKPIHTSPLHRDIYRRFARRYGGKRQVLVVSEPAVLIRYEDLYLLERAFCYDFPPKFLDKESRTFFVERLRALLAGKLVSGCLPGHHARLVNDAIGKNWKNYWKGDLFSMMRKAARIVTHPPR